MKDRIFLMNFLFIVAYYMMMNFDETNWPHIFLCSSGMKHEKSISVLLGYLNI